jgi:heme a synthase
VDQRQAAFRRFAWAVLAYNVMVVLFGAYVRASGSGAGCGAHWPLCNGQMVPRAPKLETIIEFTHRITSGLALVAVIALVVWAYRAFPRAGLVRRLALASLVFILIEAALGAGLVLFEYVDKNISVGRAIYLSLHLTNTQLLLASLTLAAIFASPSAPVRLPQWRKPGLNAGLALAALPVALLVSVSGAVAALGDTLFPSATLESGLRADFSPTAHILVRLRMLHPGLAVLGGAFVLYAVLSAIRTLPALRKIATLVCVAVVLQLGLGALNVALLAPTWLQIGHLLMADILWILLVRLVVEVLPAGLPARPVREARVSLQT